MKKLILTLAIFTITTTVFAQYKGGSDGDVKPNVIKVNPLGIIFGIAGVSYERALDSKSSAQFDINFGGLSVSGNKYTNLGAGVNYRRYFGSTAEAPKGFYIMPGIGFLNTKIKTSGGSGSSTGVTFKAVGGNQWILGSGFAIDLNAGFQYANITPSINGVNYDKFSGFFPALGFSLGYNF
jgi:hypothetical protein